MKKVTHAQLTVVSLKEKDAKIRDGVQALLEMGAYGPAIVAEVVRQSGTTATGADSPQDLMQRVQTVLHLLGVAAESEEIPSQDIINTTILTTALLRQVETAMGWNE